MNRILQLFPLHVFLLPAFFLLHVLNGYYGLIPGKQFALFGFYYCTLSVLLLLVGRLLLGSLSKAGIWATGLLLVFYFFGSFHDLLKKLSLPGFLTSYVLLLSLFLVYMIALLFYLKKSASSFRKGHQYLNILFAALVLIEIAVAAWHIASNKQQQNNYSSQLTPVVKTLPAQPLPTLPDIFFIVFDEYASSQALKQYCNYNNAFLDSILQANRFYTASKAQSNYNSTPLSIASCFNLQYFNIPLEGNSSTTKQILQSWYSLKKSQLPVLLAEKGYAIYNFGVSDLDNHPVTTSRYFTQYETLPLYQETLWGRIERDIWWNIFRLNMPLLQQKGKENYAREASRFVTRNLQNLHLTIQELRKQDPTPKFVFAHLMMPHAPFYLDEKGGLQNDPAVTADLYNKSLYLKQLAYCNQWIDSLLQAVNQPLPRPRAVIIEGDHGFRDPNPLVNRKKQFMNLNTYYFSDGDYSLLYDSISPVNTFKVVFNKYFHTSLPLSKDSTILLK